MSTLQQTAVVPKSIFFGWWLVAATFVCFAFSASTICFVTFGVFVVPLENEFGWTRAEITFASTLASLSSAVIALIAGALLDRFGPRRILLLSIPCFSTAVASLYFLPNNLYVLYAFWILIPFAGIGCWPTTFSKATVAWFDRRLGLAVGIGAAGIGVGAVIVPLIAAALMVNFGWRLAYVGIALISLLITWTAAALFIFDSPAAKGTTIDNGITASIAARPIEAAGLTFRETARQTTYRLLVVIFFLLGTTSFGLLVHQVPMLIDRGFAPQGAAKVAATLGVALIVGRLLTGWLIDRYFAPHVMAAYLIGALIAFSIYATGQTGPIVVVSAILMGLLLGGEFDVLAFVIRRYFGYRSFGKIYGSLYAIFQLGGAIGTFAAGYVRTSTGTYTIAMWGFAVLCAIIIVIFMMLGPYDKLERGQPA